MTATEKMDFIAWAKRVTTLLVVVVLTYCVAIGQLSLSRKNSEAWSVPVDNVQQIQTQCIVPKNMIYQASKPAPRKFVPSKPVTISKALQVSLFMECFDMHVASLMSAFILFSEHPSFLELII